VTLINSEKEGEAFLLTYTGNLIAHASKSLLQEEDFHELISAMVRKTISTFYEKINEGKNFTNAIDLAIRNFLVVALFKENEIVRAKMFVEENFDYVRHMHLTLPRSEEPYN
jgi:hypothetical protein